MRDLVDTTEMYLRTVYELEEEGIIPLRARIAERLEQSGPTVSQTVARLERDGLMVVEEDRSLSLTTTGRQRATEVMRKHRLAERLLTDVLKLDLTQVHEEACRWEHVMSKDVEERVVAVLNDPYRSPFGNPIPALDELGVKSTPDLELGERASDVATDTPTSVKVVQMSEILQLDKKQFAILHDAGIGVGAVVTVENGPEKGCVSVTGDNGERVLLRKELAHALRVVPAS